MAPKLNCNTQRRDATSKPVPELGRLFATAQTLDWPNLAVIGKPNSTSTTTPTSYIHSAYLHTLCLRQPSSAYLAATPSLSVVYTAVVKLHLAQPVQRVPWLLCLPSSILAADRLSTTPDTPLVSVLLHHHDFAAARNNTSFLMAHQPSAPTVARNDAVDVQTRSEPIRVPVALT